MTDPHLMNPGKTPSVHGPANCECRGYGRTGCGRQLKEVAYTENEVDYRTCRVCIDHYYTICPNCG